MLLFFAGGLAGSLTHLIFNWGSASPLIGASASSFAIIATTFRFVPQTEDPLKALFWPDKNVRYVKRISLRNLLKERRSLIYVVICMVIYPLGLTALIAGTSGQGAVAAHVGGFVFGLLSFRFFDTLPKTSEITPSSSALQSGKKPESLGLRLVRIGFIALAILGLISGIAYYADVFSQFIK